MDPGGARNPSPGPIFTARQRSCGKVMFSVMSICLSMGGPHVTITHDALDLTIYEPFSVYGTSNGSLPQPLLYIVQEPLAPAPPGMDKLLQFGPHRTESNPHPPPSPTCPNLFIIKHIWLASEQLTSYWNAFLFSISRSFPEKMAKIIGLRPHLWNCSFGKSWICHC